jgi:hypothetical protein
MKLQQLTVRDLLWLVLVCGLICALWVERYNHQRLQALEWMVTEMEKDGVDFYYEEKPDGHVWGFSWAKQVAERESRIGQLEAKIKRLEAAIANASSPTSRQAMRSNASP